MLYEYKVNDSDFISLTNPELINKPEEIELDDIENIQSQIKAKINQINEIEISDLNQTLPLIISIEESVDQINDRPLIANSLFFINGFHIFLFTILKNENPENILPVFSLLSKITKYPEIANAAYDNHVLDYIIPLLYNQEIDENLLFFSFRIFRNLLFIAIEKDENFLSYINFCNLPINKYTFLTLEFLVFCSKECDKTLPSLDIIRCSSKITLMNHQYATLLLWITCYLANQNIGDYDVYSALIEGIDGHPSIFQRSLEYVNPDNELALQPFIQSFVFLIKCEPLLNQLLEKVSLDFIFDILNSETKSVLSDITLIIKLVEKDLISSEYLSQEPIMERICNLLTSSDFLIKRRSVKLLSKMIPKLSKEAIFYISNHSKEDILDLAENGELDSFYSMLCIDYLLFSLDESDEKNDLLQLLNDNNYLQTLEDSIDSFSNIKQKEAIQIMIEHLQQLFSCDES